MRNVLFTDCLRQRDENVKRVSSVRRYIRYIEIKALFLNESLENLARYNFKHSVFGCLMFQIVPLVTELIESGSRFHREEVSFDYFSSLYFAVKFSDFLIHLCRTEVTA